MKTPKLYAASRAFLADRWERAQRARRDAGYTTETVIVTALITALAIAALAIIAHKVLDKAHSISF